jgi:DNA-binding PadR family transcriptional regulator
MFHKKEPAEALKPSDFHILLALADAPVHGYGLMKEVARQSDGAVELEIGSLYRLLDRLLEAGWIDAGAPAPAGSDERRRYYRITASGKRVLQAEATRLRGLVQKLRKHPLLGDAGGAR